MQMESKPSYVKRFKKIIIGDARSPLDKSIFHKLSLIAFFAWIGIGADGLSSSAKREKRDVVEKEHFAIAVRK